MKSRTRRFVLTSLSVSFLLHLLFVWGAFFHQLGGIPELAREAERMFRVEEVDSRLLKERLPAPAWAALRREAPAVRDISLEEVQELIRKELPLPPVVVDEFLLEVPEIVGEPEVVRQEIAQIEKAVLVDEVFPLPRRIVPRVERRPGRGLSPLDALVGRREGRPAGVGEPLREAISRPVLKEALAPLEIPLEKIDEKIDKLEAEALRELVPKHPPLDELLDIRLATYHKEGDPRGFFRLTISPRPGKKIPSLAKDVLFIVDCTYTIGQRRLELVKKGLRECLRNLRPGDRFNLIAFGSQVFRFSPTLIPFGRHDRRALATFLGRLFRTGGDTDIYSALHLLTRIKVSPERPLIVLFISDGRPTIGLRESSKIIHRITRDNALRASIYSLGIGRWINRYLLDLLTYRNRGSFLMVPRHEEIPARLTEFFRSLSDPILINPVINIGGIEAEDVHPRALPNLYQERELRIYGRYDEEEIFGLRLVGHSYAGLKEVVWRKRIAEAERGEADIAREWAYHRIYYLIGRMADEGQNEEMAAEVRYLSRKYNIPTPYARRFLFWRGW